ncbi:hypothetical protein ABMA27_002357 [Loxostege sticticalis]|uniref:Ommochrome-binding protein-like n=1 Tax=Loxostege sticticalis TaxID=481309 RepID=A0ABR3HXG6_LOXSC
MNLVILLAVAALVGGNAADECSGFYRVPSEAGQVLKDGVGSPFNLALDRDTNTLFFSNSLYKDEESMYLNLTDGTSGSIRDEVVSGFAHAYDSQHQILYIGGRNGIFKFDYDTKTAVNMNITNGNIWHMFYRNGLYFSTFSTFWYRTSTFVYKDGKLEHIEELKKSKVISIAVDEDGSLFFADDEGLKRVKNGQFFTVGDYIVNGFNTDANGKLYFSTPTAIYKLSGAVVKKVASFDRIFGFAIESDRQLIYSEYQSVVRVTLTPDMCVDDKEVEHESSNNTLD